MRKIFFTLTAFLAMAMLFASCEKNAGPDNTAAITIEFSLDDDSGATKSSSTAQLGLNNGCTVAFYSKSSGNLLATGACEGSTRKIIITSVPTENCNVYAVGNATFDWPSTQSSLASKEMSIDVTKNYIPRSTRTGSNAYSWNVGTTYLAITDMPKMYSKISVYRNQPSGTDFTATSAKVLNCPNVIYPFGNTSTGTAGTKDVATSADITLFNNGNHFTLWVPSEGATKVELKGTRTNGSGINYTDTYTITVPAISREDSKNTEVIVNGENSGEQIVVVIGNDTRSVSFGTSTLNVVGDGTNYSTYVKGVAGNGETGWTYNLSWTGVSELAGNTTISVNGQPAISLGTSGSISLPGDGNNKNIVINSTYSGSTQKTINLYALSSDNVYSLAYMTVNISGHQPKWKTATLAEMQDIYIDNVLNLGSSTTMTRSQILSYTWQNFNSYWGVSDFNTVGLADFFIDLEGQMESSVLTDLYGGGYPYSACSPYLSSNGNAMLSMYRQRLGLE